MSPSPAARGEKFPPKSRGLVSCYQTIDAGIIRHHFQTDTPFHVRGFARDWPAVGQWNFAELKSRLAQERDGRVFRRWFRGPSTMLSDEIPTSPLLVPFIDSPENFPIRHNKAIWLSPAGNVTSLHYDGWAFDGFNIQITGRKEFTLYPPDVRFRKLPYTQMMEDCRTNDQLKLEHPGDTVDMLPGDLLFTPRFWYHEVRAYDDSINVQYHVGRKSTPPFTTAALQYSLDSWTLLNCPRLVPPPALKELSEYPDILMHFARPIPRYVGAAHAALQLARITFKAIWDYKRLMALRKAYTATTLDELTQRPTDAKQQRIAVGGR